MVRQIRDTGEQDGKSKQGDGRATEWELPISCVKVLIGHNGVREHRKFGKIGMVAAPHVWEYVPPLRRVMLPLTAVMNIRKMGGIEVIVWTWGWVR